MSQQQDEEATVSYLPPTKDGWYTYDGGSQLMIFRLTSGQWYAYVEYGDATKCDWGYIEQALGVWKLVPLVPQVPMDFENLSVVMLRIWVEMIADNVRGEPEELVRYIVKELQTRL